MSNGKPAIQQVQIKINLNELEIRTCPYCNSSFFTTGQSILKRLPAIQSPSGKPQLIRIDLVVCANCGTVFQVKDDELHTVASPQTSGFDPDS